MKFILTSLLLFMSINSMASQERSTKQPKNVKCIKKELKKTKSLEKAYQNCSIKK